MPSHPSQREWNPSEPRAEEQSTKGFLPLLQRQGVFSVERPSAGIQYTQEFSLLSQRQGGFLIGSCQSRKTSDIKICCCLRRDKETSTSTVQKKNHSGCVQSSPQELIWSPKIVSPKARIPQIYRLHKGMWDITTITFLAGKNRREQSWPLHRDETHQNRRSQSHWWDSAPTTSEKIIHVKIAKFGGKDSKCLRCILPSKEHTHTGINHICTDRWLTSLKPPTHTQS